MIYLAAFLVFAALFFFLYAASLSGESPLIEKKRNTKKTTASRKIKVPATNPSSAATSASKFQPVLRDRLFNVKYPNYRNSSEEDLKIRKERSLVSEKYKSPEEIPSIDEEETSGFQNFIDEDEIQFEPSKKPVKVEEKEEEVNSGYKKEFKEIEVSEEEDEKEKVQENIPSPKIEIINHREEEKKPEVTQINGVLFLDFGRKIPFDYRKFRDVEWQENSFMHFKRIGDVKVLEYNGTVQFHSPVSSHELSLENIEQIVFYDNAFTLIPHNPTHPTSLIFSMETGKFKTLMTERFRQ
ncbi:MAG: hypothetical protein KDK36_07355 [Leptospiraceae bacterium]|nr:hypothetical protein [Leptospiraceae bacterium]